MKTHFNDGSLDHNFLTMWLNSCQTLELSLEQDRFVIRVQVDVAVELFAPFHFHFKSIWEKLDLYKSMKFFDGIYLDNSAFSVSENYGLIYKIQKISKNCEEQGGQKSISMLIY